MATIDRKFKRRKGLKFRKNIKKTMKNFEKMVRCTNCNRVPDVIHGEKIDEWHMNVQSESISLTCPECRGADQC